MEPVIQLPLLASASQYQTPNSSANNNNNINTNNNINYSNTSTYVKLYQQQLLAQQKNKEASRPMSRSSTFNESQNSAVSKTKLKNILKRIDPEQKLDADVEDILADLTTEFINTIAKSACQLARHRRSEVVEAKDAQLIVKRNYDIRVPGFGVEFVPELINKRKIRNEDHEFKVAEVAKATRKAGVAKRSTRLRAKQLNKN